MSCARGRLVRRRRLAHRRLRRLAGARARSLRGPGALLALLWLLAGGAAAQTGFGLEDVAIRARQLAAQPWSDPAITAPEWLLEIDDVRWKAIRFWPDRAIWREPRRPFSVRLFHLGGVYDHPVRVNVVTSTAVTPVPFSTEQFEYGSGFPVGDGGDDPGYAGLSLHYPIRSASVPDAFLVFLGDSSFRALGRDQVFGLSAHGLLLDPEDPDALRARFREFWLVRPPAASREVTVYALLDSPHATGAYRFVIAPGPRTRTDVLLRLFARDEGGRIGVGGLSSTFLHGETTRGDASDYRPEVHDSDGLLLASVDGEWTWRPLANPEARRVSRFAMQDPAGFGLIQRDRDFDHYQDFDARRERKPSAWVVPQGAWGAGRVELVETPSADGDETNVIACWVPEQRPTADAPLYLGYSIQWYGEDRRRPPLAQVVATRRAASRNADASRFLVDFEGSGLRDLPAGTEIEAVVMVQREQPEGGDPVAEVKQKRVIRNPVTGGRRLVLEVRSLGDAPVDVRAYLQRGDRRLTETWSYRLEQP